MPTYCFTTNDGETVERFFKMGKARRRVRLTDGRLATRDFTAEKPGIIGGSSCWPMESYALGCNPDCIEQQIAHDRRIGLRDTEYNPDNGSMVLRGREQRNRVMKAYGFFDRDAGYGDHAEHTPAAPSAEEVADKGYPQEEGTYQ